MTALPARAFDNPLEFPISGGSEVSESEFSMNVVSIGLEPHLEFPKIGLIEIDPLDEVSSWGNVAVHPKAFGDTIRIEKPLRDATYAIVYPGGISLAAAPLDVALQHRHSVAYRAMWLGVAVLSFVWGGVFAASFVSNIGVTHTTAVFGAAATLGLMVTLIVAGRSNATSLPR